MSILIATILGVVVLSVLMAECFYSGWYVVFVLSAIILIFVMLSFVLLKTIIRLGVICSVTMLSAVILSVIMLNVAAPVEAQETIILTQWIFEK